MVNDACSEMQSSGLDCRKQEHSGRRRIVALFWEWVAYFAICPVISRCLYVSQSDPYFELVCGHFEMDSRFAIGSQKADMNITIGQGPSDNSDHYKMFGLKTCTSCRRQSGKEELSIVR
jgi:hypothetical protein